MFLVTFLYIICYVPIMGELRDQGRSVVLLSRYAREAKGKRAPEARGARGVWGACSPRKFLFLGPRKCHFPCFSGGIYINRNMKNANYSVT